MLSAGDIAGIIVLGVLGLAIAVVLALVLGRNLFLRDPTGSPRAAVSTTASKRPSPSSTPSSGGFVGAPYRGRLRTAAVASARASCGQHGLRSASGRRIDFQGPQAVDGRPGTAWRCKGDGVGRTLVITMKGVQRIAAVGLIPGFAAVDPITGADGFATDRRVLRVRWALGGRTGIQTLNPARPNLQLLRIPPTRAGVLTMTILATTAARTDVFAVSDVAVYGVAG